MSGHQYLSNNASLFEDVDDDIFLKNSRVGQSNNEENDFYNQRQQYEQKRREIEDRTLTSSQRSMGLLRDTEQVGIATAEELSRQREQLDKTRRQLEDINSTLRFSQKHLTGLKSVFGGLKNYLSGNKNDGVRMTSSPSGSQFTDDPPSPTAEQRYDSHPVTRMRQDPPMQTHVNASGGFNQQLDRNLDEMADSLSRLKGLAIDLNLEIDSQNDLIDDISNKVEDVDVKIGKQNKDMFKILGKK